MWTADTGGKLRRVLALTATLLVGGCATANEVFRGDGFYHQSYAYRIRHGGPNGRDFVGPDWVVDNVFRRGTDLKWKVGAEYETEYRFDTDGDGRDDVQTRAYVYDLRLNHRRRDATIWVRTIPISENLRGRELRVLARTYVESVAGAGYAAVDLGDGRVGVEERRYATQVLDARPMVVGGREAFGVVFDVANVDQLQLQRTSRRRRVRLVFVRTEFRYQIRRAVMVRQPRYLPVVMVLGYANLPEDFDTDHGAFEALLSQVQFRDPAPPLPPGLSTQAPAQGGSPAAPPPDAPSAEVGTPAPANAEGVGAAPTSGAP